MRIVGSFFIFMLLSKASFGQFEISFGSSYEIPLGEMGEIYNNSPAYQISFYFKSQQYKNKRKSLGVEIGYAALKPTKEVFYYEVISNNGVEYGTIQYEDYTSYQLMLTGRSDILLSKKFEFFYGGDFGLHYTNFAYQRQDRFTDEDSQEIIARVALSPKLGINVVLIKSLYLSIYGKYTISAGMTENSKNIINQYLAMGAALGVRI